MKKEILAAISLWCSISLPFISCKTNPPSKAKEEAVIEHPAPIAEPQTDTLKSYLDRERQKRRKP